MCGIIGYIGERQVVPILIEGLKRLEYRGYDSAGVALIQNGTVEVRRTVGKLKTLEDSLRHVVLEGTVGVGHTRWATHGRPSEENAHPHRAGSIALVQNGIVENYLPLKEKLRQAGRTFQSETDTEVLVHLIDFYFEGDLEAAMRRALREVVGAYALAAVSSDDPEKVVAARHSAPLVIGLGKGEFFVASDIPAILNHTRDVIFLNDNEIAVLSREGVKVSNLEGQPVPKEVKKILWDLVMAEKGGYKHFMLKEIYEQPRAFSDTLRGRLALEAGNVLLDEVQFPTSLQDIEQVFLVACGTSWHAALIGKFLIERLAQVPVEVDIASEFRYRNPLVSSATLMIPISQSGETADTLAALREAKQRGATTLSICNVVDSTIARESHGILYTHAGPEIGVASTKAFTSQIAALHLLALHLGRLRGTLSREQARQEMQALLGIPNLLEEVLELDEEIEQLARRFADKRDFLYLGRGINYPVALEGALKLKEISYIHAEGYPAGEMKHGPIALIDEKMPVVVIAPKDSVYDKILSNIQEVKTRGGVVIALGHRGDSSLKSKVDDWVGLPEVSSSLFPILAVIPLQLLAYHIAVRRGCDVDQPRNLAKSVTVE
ncbi:MAG: glutamine--fructose-6-phosphate transaminase (isomerizing) [Candidatus Tectomicrobia bacterium]|uniref:Glutamine--fructose-6-phosphate aminotransferase [isomerizing] n=1 Tax=Tectimicrobiota bacterium TaxID=2528274 RepID=A0A932GPZ9_UNCTE|nr:glutamine--fructose-6-phosphate transaminase (isomerizing) [Candidatus Tectomicrobia bacterium]